MLCKKWNYNWIIKRYCVVPLAAGFNEIKAEQQS